MRESWVSKREGTVVTQMHYARKGVVTEEMAYVAAREKAAELDDAGLVEDREKSALNGHSR